MVTVQRPSLARLRAFREPWALLAHSIPSAHTPHTGITWGRPSVLIVDSQ